MNGQGPQPRPLLTIDVLAEIRKLSTSRFKTSADATVGFVGFLSSLGFQRIDIAASRRKIAFDCRPHPHSWDWLYLLADTLDPDRPHLERHNALVRLETDYGLNALAPFFVPGVKVEIRHRSRSSNSGETLTLNQSSKPRTARQAGSGAHGASLRVIIRGKLGPTADHAAALEHYGRFSPVDLRIKGRRISKGHRLEDMLLSKRIRREDLHGVIGLPRKTGLCELHILKNGMVSQTKMHAIHRGLEFHAVVEPKELSSDQIWGALRQSAEELLFDLKDRINELDETDRKRGVDLIVERSPFARKGALLDGAQLFPQLHGPALSIEEIRNRARKETLYVITTGNEDRRHHPRSRTVLLLSPSARNILEQHHGISLHETSRQRRLFIHPKTSRRVRWLWRRLTGRSPLRDAPEVSREELIELADSMEKALGSGLITPFDLQDTAPSVVLASGKRAPLTVDKQRNLLEIDTDAPVVRACARAHRRDPTLLPAALAALFGGRVTLLETGLAPLGQGSGLPPGRGR